MPKFKDLFISYGRRESLGFVTRLHQQLKLAGYDAWFDKINIPHGEDYVDRINHGIESAHNFIYVMAPHSLCSPHCLIELEYARLLGKRVIPIDHNVVFNTDKGALSEEIQQKLANFYQSHNIEDPKITTSQQLLERSLAQVGQTNWLPAKENISNQECDSLGKWAQGYETHWHQHDDLTYLNDVKLPQFGHIVDELDKVIVLIKGVIERHKDYVQQHTLFLYHALVWKKNQSIGHYLLVGKEQKEATSWLKTDFVEGEQTPCIPNELVCDFICESRKNSENRMTDCFICYDHYDKAKSQKVTTILSRYAITTWRHDRDIQKGKIYAQVINEGIESANSILFFLSPHSIESSDCRDELSYALQHNKKIIPLLITTTSLDSLPPELSTLQYIDFTKQNNDQAIADILRILQQDEGYFTHHRALLLRALAWQRSNQKASFLLRGYNLENAKTWLRLNTDREQYAPTNLHHDLITHSDAAKGQLGTDVFISYSRKDGDFARQLNFALQKAGKTVWFDQESIATGVDFEAELYKGIDRTDNFIFIVSPDSVNSEYCEREVNYASLHCKRILTILARDTNPADIPEVLQKINWIDFINVPFVDQFPELVQAIELDQAHTHQHTLFQQRATEWESSKKNQDYLLNHSACEKAEEWLKEAKDENKNPAPTEIQQEHIVESRNVIEHKQKKEKQRQQRVLYSVIMGMIIALVLAGFAWQKSDEAVKQRNEALNTRSLYLAKTAEQALKEDKTTTTIELAVEGLPKYSETYKDYPDLKPEVQKEIISTLHDAVQKQWQGILGHDEPVKQAIFSPDGKQLLTVAGMKAYLWDRKTLKLVHVFYGHNSNINKALFSPDNSKIITILENDTARVWNRKVGKQLYILPEHKYSIVDVIFSPDSSKIITLSTYFHLGSGNRGMAYLWESESGELLQTFPKSKEIDNLDDPIIEYLAFSPDSSAIIIAAPEDYNNAEAYLWDIELKKILVSFSDHGDSVVYVDFSPDGSQVLTTSRDGMGYLWDIESGKVIHKFKHDDIVWEAKFSPDGKQIITVSEDKTARLWDIVSGKLIHKLSHENPVNNVSFSQDNSKIIVNSYNYIENGLKILSNSAPNKAYIWDRKSGNILYTLSHNENLNNATLSPDSSLIFTASDDHTARLWNIESGKSLHAFINYKKNINYDNRGSVYGFNTVSAISSDSSKIFTISSLEENIAYLWSNTNQLLHTLTGNEENYDLINASFSPDNTLIAAYSRHIIHLWNSQSGKYLYNFSTDIKTLSFSQDSSKLIIISNEDTLNIIDIKSKNIIYTQKNVYTASYSNNNNQLLIFSKNKLNILDNKSRKIISSISLKYNKNININGAIFLPNKKQIAIVGSVKANNDSCVEEYCEESYLGQTLLVDIQQQKAMFSLNNEAPSYEDIGLKLSPDSTKLAIMYEDSANVIDIKSGKQLYSLVGEEVKDMHITRRMSRTNIFDVSFSSDSSMIVTSSFAPENDKMARVWDSQTGQLLYTLEGHDYFVRKAEFTPDGSHILTTSGDGTARLWLAFKNADELANYAKNLLDAPPLQYHLSCEQRKEFLLEELERCKKMH